MLYTLLLITSADLVLTVWMVLKGSTRNSTVVIDKATSDELFARYEKLRQDRETK